MTVEVRTVRLFFTKLNVIALILAIIILGLSVASSPKAQAMFLGYAILLIIIILLGQFRVSRSGDLRQAGERAVQTIWLWTSLGLVAATMPPTPYFELSQSIMAAMMVIGAILVLMGAYSLIKIRKLTGVYLSV